MMSIIALTDRAILTVSGPDAKAFLQGLVTCDIDHVPDNAATHGALLAPQGKILFDFLIVNKGATYLIDCPKDDAQALLKRLGFYKLRADIEISASEDLKIFALDDNDASNDQAIPDPRSDSLAKRLYTSEDLTPTEDLSTFHAARIDLGIPENDADGDFSDYFPQDVAMDQWNGVAFDKGCFVGQEVVSRMHHRGSERRRPVRVGGSNLDKQIGQDIESDSKRIGTVIAGSDNSGIAIIRIDRAAAAIEAGNPFQIADQSITLSIPDWAAYEFPTTKKSGTS